MLDYFLTDNRCQFESQFFARLCAALGMTHVTRARYHPQTNGQTERYNRMLVMRNRRYIADNQSDWDLMSRHLTYAYNSQLHLFAGHSPFPLTLL